MAEAGGTGKALGVVMSDMVLDNLTVNEDMTVVGTLTAATQAITSETVATLAVTASATIGNASTDTIGFYGATATTQPAAIAAVTTAALTSVTTTASTTTTPFGYCTSTQADAIIATLNAVAVRCAALTTQGNAIDAALTTVGIVA